MVTVTIEPRGRLWLVLQRYYRFLKWRGSLVILVCVIAAVIIRYDVSRFVSCCYCDWMELPLAGADFFCIRLILWICR